MNRAENFRESTKKYKKEEFVIPESRVIHSKSPSLPRYSQTHFFDKRRVSSISGDIYFNASQETNIPQMAYQLASKQNKARPSLDEFNKQTNLTTSFLMNSSPRSQPTIVPINPQTGKRVDVKPIEPLHLDVPISTPLANSPPASPILKTPNIDLIQKKRNPGDQVISEIRRFSQPSNIAQGLNRMNLNYQGHESNVKVKSHGEIDVQSNNEDQLERFDKEARVIGEICGQSMSEISGVRPIVCARRGSVIHNSSPEPQPSSNGGRRPSIYAQLDEFISNSAPTNEPLYRTFTVPKTTQNKRDSIELPSITLSEHHDQ